MDKYLELRAAHPVFAYKAFRITETENLVKAEFEFEIEGLAGFSPSWSFPKPNNVSAADDPMFNKIIFSLGMAEAVSYWKAACSPEMHVKCGELSADQTAWWKKLYFNGLGEFFYVNGIDADENNFINIISSGVTTAEGKSADNQLSGCLIPIGGGKDSALTLETLVRSGMDCKCYAINKRRSISATVETSGLHENDLITAQRSFDRSLIKLNNSGYLNGHTPFSAIVAFSALAEAYLYKRQYIVLSNESSANESTVAGSDVNHQYSKSFEFERDFHEYEEKFLHTGISYFSFLRPLTEFQIAKMFVTHEKYLPIFRSCNLGSKVSPDIWCSECPKCLFVALILSPFVSLERLIGIFGRDILSAPEMLPAFKELIGLSEHKPFECVGSVDEARLAATLAVIRCEREKTELPLLLEEFKKTGLFEPDTAAQREAEYCQQYNSENLLPECFAEILKNEMRRIL